MTPEETVVHWRKSGPAIFAQEALGAKPTPQQLEGGEALVKYRKISIRSGHGTGKSAFMAWTVIWFVVCYYPTKVPCTAPTGHQLSDILWAEIALWHRKLKERLPELADQFEWGSEKYFMKSAPRESFAVARTARPENPEALQGFHSENLLFVIDEASGVPEPVFQVAEGALSTDGCYVVMAANPTRESGYFFDSHHKMRARWGALHWDGELSPLVSREYVEDMRLKYGILSPIYQVRVKGNFAPAADGIISLALCEDAKNRDVKGYGDEIWGVDVARFGDDATALAKRRGNALTERTREYYGKDTMQTAGIVKNEYDNAKVKPAAIHIDVIGIGAGVVDRCKEMGLPVRGINVAESPSVSDLYSRLRDELWFKGREWFEARDCKLCDDDDLIAELTTPKYSILSNGLIKVESKDEMKKRGIASPNRADAFLLTFAPSMVKQSMTKKIAYPEQGIV